MSESNHLIFSEDSSRVKESDNRVGLLLEELKDDHPPKRRKLSSSQRNSDASTKDGNVMKNEASSTCGSKDFNGNIGTGAGVDLDVGVDLGTSDSKNKKSNKNKKPKTKHLDRELLELRRTIQLCCASDDFNTAIKAYHTKHVEEKVRMEAQSYYNLLNLCAGGLGERGIHIGTPKPDKSNNAFVPTMNYMAAGCNDNINTNINIVKEKETKFYSPQERKDFAYKIKHEMDELEIPLNETAFTAIVRLLCQPEINDLDEAEKILNQAENTQQCKPKLRMYGCLVDAFCNEHNNNLAGALRVWKRMNNLERKDKNGNLQNAIVLTEKEYCIIMKCATRIGDRGVMERVLSEIAEDVLVPSLDTKDTIIAWYQSEHAMEYYDEKSKDVQSALDLVSDLPASNAPSMGPVHYRCTKVEKEQGPNSKSNQYTWKVTSGDKIDSKSGILQTGCLKGQTLKPVQLQKDCWKEMLEMNEDIVVKGEVASFGKIPCAFAGGGKGKKRILTKDLMEKRIKQWQSFKSFLNERVGLPFCNGKSDKNNEGGKIFDIVIDGANVGYYQRNFAHAPKYVDYKQIDWVVQHFQNENKKVLLFMHERHFNKNLMPRWAEPILKKWEDAGVLYRTPYGANDDWFWMHAALWCGRRTMVLSNDLMRDHHFQMLAHRSFLRWKERHQVYFDFGEWIGNKREVILTYPEKYSRRIQLIPGHGLVIPLPRKGDINRFLDGQHEADDTSPSDETYVSIAMSSS